MEIETQNAVGFFFPNTSFSQIYFEAVANALDAGATKITILVEIKSYHEPESLKITITDNGLGFTDLSFERFRRLLKPKDSFHKGLGRLVYLKYFNEIEISSSFDDIVREFVWSSEFDGENHIRQMTESDLKQTRLTFVGFNGARINSYDDLKAKSINEQLILELLPRLYEMKKSGKNIEIVVSLITSKANYSQEFFSDSQSFNLSLLPELKEIPIDATEVDFLSNIVLGFRVKSEFGHWHPMADKIEA